ncbi:MAG: aminotransferase class V-fold PLP-dependent enzyme [Spirochaetaceae bacterium]|nr:aminotransferase class V-fold PLP-dependent enzyme [Spirochaetaceae bacterium]
MFRFNNDYNQGAHSAVLNGLVKSNDESFPGYGVDEVCDAAAKAILKYTGGVNAQVHFLVGGTQTNALVISMALRSIESVLCAKTGHIAVHETGAIEKTGHKVETLPDVDGKITAEQIDAACTGCENSCTPDHITRPRMVYISQPTELGTMYSKKELSEISKVCKKHNVYLYVDGARLAYSLGAVNNDVTIADLAQLTDVFYIGGTKCGALFGEAVVVVNDELKPHFRSYVKQSGGLLAKGWLLGLQFLELFTNDLYLKIGKTAVEQAIRIKNAFESRGIKMAVDSPTNQQFVKLSKAQAEYLSKDFYFEREEVFSNGDIMVRFCTGWSSAEEGVAALVKKIGEMPQ